MGSAPQACTPPSKRACSRADWSQLCSPVSTLRSATSPTGPALGPVVSVSPLPVPLAPQLTTGPLYSASLSGRLLQSSGFLPAGQHVCAKVYSYSLQGYR